MEIEGVCPHCQAVIGERIETGQTKVPCPKCSQNCIPQATDDFLHRRTLNQCPLCGCAHLYRQKDFNRKLGVGILIVGIGLSFFTYGLSLLVVTAIDWWLYRRVKDVGCCYLCDAAFRHDAAVSALKPFDLVLHDHYQNLKRSKN